MTLKYISAAKYSDSVRQMMVNLSVRRIGKRKYLIAKAVTGSSRACMVSCNVCWNLYFMDRNYFRVIQEVPCIVLSMENEFWLVNI